MNVLEQIIENNPDETFLKADGFDDAVIGLDISTRRLIYAYDKCIDILAKDMSEDEAIEYFEFNTLGTFVGEKTPIFMDIY
jgi:hypothetical protein